MIKRRTYLCICEGQQETMYLAHIARLLTHFPERVVKFNTTIGPPSELKKHYEEYDSAALFDQDGCQNAFEEGIRVCQAIRPFGATQPQQKTRLSRIQQREFRFMAYTPQRRFH